MSFILVLQKKLTNKEDIAFRKSILLEAAIKQARAEERAIDNIWTRVSGIVVSEAQRLWDDGYRVDTTVLIKGLRDRLNYAIAKEEGQSGF